MEDGAVYRREPDGSESIIGFAANPTEAQIMIEIDREKVDYDIGYHWHTPKEVKHVTERYDP